MWLNLAMLLFWVAVAVVVAWVIIRVSKHNLSAENQTPIDIAKARYAKGEITKEQLDQIKEDLNE